MTTVAIIIATGIAVLWLMLILSTYYVWREPKDPNSKLN